MALTLNGSANTLTGLATAGAGIPGSEVVAASALANGGIIAVKNVIKKAIIIGKKLTSNISSLIEE